MTEKPRSTRYTYINNTMNPKELLEHFENMSKFWKAAGDKTQTSIYTNKAEKLRKEISKGDSSPLARS